ADPSNAYSYGHAEAPFGNGFGLGLKPRQSHYPSKYAANPMLTPMAPVEEDGFQLPSEYAVTQRTEIVDGARKERERELARLDAERETVRAFQQVKSGVVVPSAIRYKKTKGGTLKRLPKGAGGGFVDRQSYPSRTLSHPVTGKYIATDFRAALDVLFYDGYACLP
ncbi:hypothetical protein KIPB_005679, partial [Kipferlia bialata]